MVPLEHRHEENKLQHRRAVPLPDPLQDRRQKGHRARPRPWFPIATLRLGRAGWKVHLYLVAREARAPGWILARWWSALCCRYQNDAW